MTRRVPALLAAVLDRDGERCSTPACRERAACAVPRRPGLGTPAASRLPASDLVGLCEKHARERDLADRRHRLAAATEALTRAQTALDLPD